MNFYLSAVDDLLKHPQDNPSIGLLLCRSRKRMQVEYALRDMHKPIGVAEWETKLFARLPKELKGSLRRWRRSRRNWRQGRGSDERLKITICDLETGPEEGMVEKILVPAEHIEHAILVLRGQKVLLDSDLAALYAVPVKALNRAVKRNIERFPADFMFQLTDDEVSLLRRHFGTSNAHGAESLRSQFGTSKAEAAGRYLPYAFTEQGVAMLSSVLRSPRAVQVNIEIMRAFVRLRQMLQQNTDLARKTGGPGKEYDGQFKMVFEAIRDLMTLRPRRRPRIGFRKGGS